MKFQNKPTLKDNTKINIIDALSEESTEELSEASTSSTQVVKSSSVEMEKKLDSSFTFLKQPTITSSMKKVSAYSGNNA